MTVKQEPQWSPWLAHIKDIRSVAGRAITGYRGLDHSREQHTFMMLLNRATENVGAIVCLFEAGWENDSMALLRALVDIYIDVRFLRTDPGVQLPRFLDYAIVTNHWKKITHQRLYGDAVDDLIRIDYARAQNANAMRDDIQTADDYVTRYHEEVARAQSRWNFKRTGWSDFAAAAKAERVDSHAGPGVKETALVYELIYRMASEALHSGIGGVLRTMTIEGSAATLDHEARPHRPTGLLILVYAAFMLTKIAMSTNEELRLGLDDELTRLDHDYLGLLGPRREPSADAQG